jgi:hypothetical protein
MSDDEPLCTQHLGAAEAVTELGAARQSCADRGLTDDERSYLQQVLGVDEPVAELGAPRQGCATRGMSDEEPWYMGPFEAADAVTCALFAHDPVALAEINAIAAFAGDEEAHAALESVYEALVLRPGMSRLEQAAQSGRLRAWAYRVTAPQTSDWLAEGRRAADIEAERTEIPRTTWIDNSLDLAAWPGFFLGTMVLGIGVGRWLYVDPVFDRAEVKRLCADIVGNPQGATAVEKAKPTPQPTSEDIKRFYKDHHDQFEAKHGRPPNEAEDIAALNAKFGWMPRKVARGLRKDRPKDKQQPGRRPSKAKGQSRHL